MLAAYLFEQECVSMYSTQCHAGALLPSVIGVEFLGSWLWGSHILHVSMSPGQGLSQFGSSSSVAELNHSLTDSFSFSSPLLSSGPWDNRHGVL